MIEIVNQVSARGLLAGFAVVEDIRLSATPPELKEMVEVLIEERTGRAYLPEELKGAVRNLLRTPAYKPTGRSKPASEYLAQAASEGRFPFINNLVDVNNYVSLSSGLPISLLDYSVTTSRIAIRDGVEGEKYVFNEGGQEIDLHGLISVCRREGEGRSVPLGTPVKDSMAAKLKDHTSAVVGIIYAPATFVTQSQLESLVTQFGELLERFGEGRLVEKVLA